MCESLNHFNHIPSSILKSIHFDLSLIFFSYIITKGDQIWGFDAVRLLPILSLTQH